MSKEFFIGDSRYIINEDNNDFKIYPADKNGYPKQDEIALTPLSDLLSKEAYETDFAFINAVINFNKNYPVFKVSIIDKLIITKDYKIYLFYKNNNKFGIYKIKINDINNYNEEYYKELLYKVLNNEISVNDIRDIRAREYITKLVSQYNENIVSNEGGSSSENAKVKVRKSGFASKLLIICLSFFTIGVITVLVIVIINKFIIK